MRRLQQIIEFLTDVDRLGFGFARAAFRPWRHREPFRVPLPRVGSMLARAGESDLDTIRSIFRDGDYAVPSEAARRRLSSAYEAIIAVGKVPLIIDAGANVGVSALWFNAEYPRARVLAIEPEPGNFAALSANIAGRGAIEAVAAAIGGESGFVELATEGASDGFRSARSTAGVQVVTIDQLASASPDAVPFIVKIDIEGFESDLFARNTGWIDTVSAIMIEVHDWMLPGTGSSANFQREMGSRSGFEIFLRGENLLYVRA